MKKDIEWLVQMINDEREILRQRFESGKGTPNQIAFDEGRDWTLAHVLRMMYYPDKLEELSKELPVLPKHVGEWITRYREKYDLYPALRLLENNTLVWGEIYEWYRMNTHKFVNVYLTGEYEVEEEPLYYALVKGHELMGSDLKYWTMGIYQCGLRILERYVDQDLYSNKKTKFEWAELGVNDSNADFEEFDEELH